MTQTHVLTWLFPFLQWLPKVTKRDLRADFIAGLTGAIVVLPQGVAFATIAGMPPQYGLYAGMIPAIVAALFGSSRQLVSGQERPPLQSCYFRHCRYMLRRVARIMWY